MFVAKRFGKFYAGRNTESGRSSWTADKNEAVVYDSKSEAREDLPEAVIKDVSLVKVEYAVRYSNPYASFEDLAWD